jgi:pSer/pThr/pTyr-binding forkhead associated (FHA) protein
VLLQENFRALHEEFPDLRRDIREIDGKIDSIMDQVRDVRKLLIELRSDVQKIIAQDTDRRERRELQTMVAVTLGQIRTSSNLPGAMKLAYQTYYVKAVGERMGHKEYAELLGKTRGWETDVAELTTLSARLVDARGNEFLLSREPLIIGRAAGYETVQFEDKFISRIHACLIYDWKSHQYLLRDLNSTNGTFLNGREVKTASLSSGDEIVMGRTSVHVEINQTLSILREPGLAHPLEGYLLVMGRSPTSKSLVCQDPYVSRLHATIIYDPRNHSYRIRDLNSTNKTAVNHQRLTGERTLRNKDVISVARTAHLTFLSANRQPGFDTKA